MAYDGNFLKITASGTSYQDEIWSWSVHYSTPGGWLGPTDYVTPTMLEAIAGHISTFHVGTCYGPAKLASVKAAWLDSQGQYTDMQQPVIHDFDPLVTSGGSGNAMLAQIALAVTLRTERRRGPGSSGRFYLPFPKMGIIDDAGMISSTTAAGIADQAVTMLNGITGELANEAHPIVASQGGVKGVPPAHVPVTRVEVGRIPDTIQRRRNALAEQHVPATTDLTTPP